METKDIFEAIAVIKELKSVLDEQNPNLLLYGTLGGAFIGAIATFIPSFLLELAKDRKSRRSTALCICAEIKSALEIAEHRQYIKHLEGVVQAISSGQMTTCTFSVQVDEGRFPVFKKHLSNIGILRLEEQTKIIQFYQLAEAFIQDIKPGGILNTPNAGLAQFSECLRIAKLARDIGNQIVSTIERAYA